MSGEALVYDYGECHVCGARMEARNIHQGFWIKGKLVVIKQVPAGVCSQCGEKVVRAQVGRIVSAQLEDPKRRRKARTMTVSVMRYAREVA